MNPRPPRPLPGRPALVGVLAAGLLAVVVGPSVGLGAPVSAAAADTTPAPTTTPAPSPTPTTPEEAPSARERRTREKAERLASALARDVAGTSRGAVRRGIPVKLSIESGRVGVRLQVKRGERWTTVSSLRASRGTTERTLKPGRVGKRRLADATVTDGRVQARYSVSLATEKVEASAAKGFRLTR